MPIAARRTATALVRVMARAFGALALTAWGTTTHAATSIATATIVPVATSTGGDLTVTSAGTITLTSGTAITVDSDNLLDFEGTVAMSASESGSTGILIGDVANRMQALTLAGTVTVTDDYTAADTNDDDVVDAPWAEGTGRYGIHSTGTNAFTGDIDIAGTINVHGNQSYAVRLDNQIDGDFTFSGGAAVIGDQSTAIALDKGVTGNVYLSGSASGLGEGVRAVTIAGDIGGTFTLDGSYSTTGYSTVYTLDSDVLAALDPALNLLQGGPTVTLSGNIAGGALFGAAVTSTDDDNTDEDGDGRTDSSQTAASIVAYGHAPALLVGSETQDITLGGLTYGSTAIDPPTVNYGLLNRGSISTSGIYSGVDTTAVQLGGLGHAVVIDNGIGIAGSVSTSAYGANATALALGDNAATPRLDVTGSLTAATVTATTSTTTDDVMTYTTVGGGTTATALDLADGANLASVSVGESATLSASATGSTANATAIRDRSDSLTSVTNSGILGATITASDDDGDGTSDTVTGSAFAIDARSNTVGLTLIQLDTAPDDDDISAPYIYGQIRLGSGDDHVSASGGFIYGALDYGAGTGRLSLTDDALYSGKMTSSGDIAMDITSGAKAYLLAGSSVKLSDLHVGTDSALALSLSTAAPSTPILVASGTAVFDDGAELDLAPDKIITTPTTFTLLRAAGISLGDITTSTRDGYIPYLYHADLATNAGETELYANFRLKSQAEAGYSANQHAALIPILAVVGQDSEAQTSLLGATDKTAFDAVYNQYLPDYSGESLLTLAQGEQSLNHTLGTLTHMPRDSSGQYWLQEYGFSTQRESGTTAGFNSTGFSFSGGRERQVFGNQMAGVYVSLTTTSPQDTYAIASETAAFTDYSLGGYWRLNSGAFRAWAHAGAGYVSLEASRNLLTTYVTHAAQAKWRGASLSAGAGASVDFKVGQWSLTPEVLGDYYRLSEDRHTETGGGDTFDLTVGSRAGHMLSSSALLKARYNTAFIRPEVWIGYRGNLSSHLADTVASFSGGEAFTLQGGTLEGGGPVAGFRFSLDNDYSYLAFEGEYGKVGEVSNASLSLRTRFQF